MWSFSLLCLQVCLNSVHIKFSRFVPAGMCNSDHIKFERFVPAGIFNSDHMKFGRLCLQVCFIESKELWAFWPSGLCNNVQYMKFCACRYMLSSVHIKFGRFVPAGIICTFSNQNVGAALRCISRISGESSLLIPFFFSFSMNVNISFILLVVQFPDCKEQVWGIKNTNH